MVSKLRALVVQYYLRSKGCFPKHVERALVNNLWFVNLAFENTSTESISEKVYAGCDLDEHVAKLKAISEWVESEALLFDETQIALTHGSEGLGAFPMLFDAQRRRELARANAVAEATERFVWSSWWDNERYGALVGDFSPQSSVQETLSELIFKQFPFKKMICIQPFVNSFKKLYILVAFIPNEGLVCGGACGESSDETFVRALSELYRHAIAVNRINRNTGNKRTFYENRLHVLSTNVGRRLLESRLDASGSETIQLPRLKYDYELKHPYQDVYTVWRCIYENQPIFLGGPVERMCI